MWTRIRRDDSNMPPIIHAEMTRENPIDLSSRADASRRRDEVRETLSSTTVLDLHFDLLP